LSPSAVCQVSEAHIMIAEAFTQTLTELVLANRILAREEVIDDFGHVSVRHPDNPEHYFLARSRSPGVVTREDIVEFTLQGEPIPPDARPMYSEIALHSSVFMARPDVNAVVHHHARSVLPFHRGSWLGLKTFVPYGSGDRRRGTSVGQPHRVRRHRHAD